MIKKNLLLLTFAALVHLTLSAQNKKDTIPAFFGYSYTPSLHWKVGNLLYHEGKQLKYKFDLNSQSSIEGNFRLSKIGIRLGFSANIENNLIGKAYQYSGYLSLKNYWLKIQSSKISGITDWTGILPIGYLKTNKFTNEYFNVDLIKTSKKIARDPAPPFMGAYWGLGYTSFKIPVQLEIDENNSKAAYDTLFQTKVISYIFGFDMLRQVSMTGGNQYVFPGKPLSKFGLWVSNQDKFGVGTASISDYGKNMLEDINPIYTIASQKFITMMIQYNLSMGVRYIVKARPVFFVFAVGYGFEGAWVQGMSTKFGNYDKKITTTGPNVLFMNHGITFKMYISWVGIK